MLLVKAPDWEGATINGVRKSWRKLTLRERLCLVTSDGQSHLVGLQSSGKPFEQLAELTEFKVLAISWLAAQYDEIERLRTQVAENSSLRYVPGCE